MLLNQLLEGERAVERALAEMGQNEGGGVGRAALHDTDRDRTRLCEVLIGGIIRLTWYRCRSALSLVEDEGAPRRACSFSPALRCVKMRVAGVVWNLGIECSTCLHICVVMNRARLHLTVDPLVRRCCLMRGDRLQARP